MKYVFGLLSFLLAVVFYPSLTDAASCGPKAYQVALKYQTKLHDSQNKNSNVSAVLPAGTLLNAEARNGGWYKVCYSNKAQYIMISNAKEVFPAQQVTMIAKADRASYINQIVVATAPKDTNTSVRVYAYERLYGEWRSVFEPLKAVIGPTGFSQNKLEGDGATPTGFYSLGTFFGSQEKPNGVNWPYKITNSYDYWIDDVNSQQYNTWVRYNGNPNTKWKLFERMNHPLYKYGIVVNYNNNPIVKGKGSAIFMHVWRSEYSTTAGCIAFAQQDIVRIMQWLSPEKHPRLLMGSYGYINSL